MAFNHIAHVMKKLHSAHCCKKRVCARVGEGPAVGRELAEPVAEEVEEELEGEDGGEGRVGRVEGLLDRGRRAVGPVELVRLQLRLEDGDAEILLAGLGQVGIAGRHGGAAVSAALTAMMRNEAMP